MLASFEGRGKKHLGGMTWRRRITSCIGIALTGQPASAENPRMMDVTGQEKPATLTPESSGTGGMTALTASTRYIISGVNWASSRNSPGEYVLGLPKSGDVFDVTNYASTSWRGGYSYRAGCGFILNTNLANQNVAGANVPCAASGGTFYAPQQFIGTANCSSCGTYTTQTWASAATSATACRNLNPPPQEITSTTHAACRSAGDLVTIYKGDQIGWRYATKDYQWLAIKDTSRFGDNDGPWMFLPNNGTLSTPCHIQGCWTP